MEAERHQEARPPISLDQAWGSCGVWFGMDRGPSRGRLTGGFRKLMAVNFSLSIMLAIDVHEEASMLPAEELLLCTTAVAEEPTSQKTTKSRYVDNFLLFLLRGMQSRSST